VSLAADEQQSIAKRPACLTKPFMLDKKLRRTLINLPLSWLDPAVLSNWVNRSRINPYGWGIILCLLFILPAIFIRGAHYEEGTTIALARSIFQDGLWPGTFLYGERLVDRPHAVTWLLGGVGLLTGNLPLWAARIPTVASLIGGASLVYWLVRRYASATAALVAMVCLIASPMMLQKTITAESDVAVSVLLFAAFVLFWRGYESGGPTVTGWLAIAVTIAIAGSVKGPQPLAYFFLGVGAFLVLRRQWINFVLLGAVGMVAGAVVLSWYFVVYQTGDWATWAAHSRLRAVAPIEWAYLSVKFCFYVTIENLPGVLLFAPLAWTVIRRGAPKSDDLVVALTLYAMICTLVLASWPGAFGRYAMPATFAIAAAAGLAYDRYAEQRRWLASGALGVACLLVAYRLVLNWIAMPLVPDKFRQEAVLGHQAAAMMQPSDKLLVSEQAVDLNFLTYIPQTIRLARPDVISRAKPPFWIMVMPNELAELQKARPANSVVPRLAGPSRNQWRLVEVRAP
jgi:4-amino-4-deoxy-L-arabinose transferase-like glycosyltransferase